MHRRVPQERGKSCRLPRTFGKGKADPKLQAHPARALTGWERSTRHTTGIAKRRKRSAARRVAGWLRNGALIKPASCLAGLWDNSVVPLGQEIVEQDRHVAFEFLSGLAARFVNLLDDTNRHRKTSPRTRLLHQ